MHRILSFVAGLLGILYTIAIIWFPAHYMSTLQADPVWSMVLGGILVALVIYGCFALLTNGAYGPSFFAIFLLLAGMLMGLRWGWDRLLGETLPYLIVATLFALVLTGSIDLMIPRYGRERQAPA